MEKPFFYIFTVQTELGYGTTHEPKSVGGRG